MRYNSEIESLPQQTPVRSFRQTIEGGPVDDLYRAFAPTYLTGSLTDGGIGASYPEFGALVTPDSGYAIERLDHYETFGIDNAVFGGKFDPVKFDALLCRLSAGGYHLTALFAVAPDVFDKSVMRGDARATLERSRPWFKRIRLYGIPAALVAQDGLELIQDEIPWDEFDVLFLGGSDAFKLGKANPRQWQKMIDEAKRRGKRIHVGRVNSKQRFQWAARIGADSVDGTYLAYGPRVNVERLQEWMESNRAAKASGYWQPQRTLFDDRDELAVESQHVAMGIRS
jgi:hypothetical protein